MRQSMKKRTAPHRFSLVRQQIALAFANGADGSGFEFALAYDSNAAITKGRPAILAFEMSSNVRMIKAAWSEVDCGGGSASLDRIVGLRLGHRRNRNLFQPKPNVPKPKSAFWL